MHYNMEATYTVRVVEKKKKCACGNVCGLHSVRKRILKCLYGKTMSLIYGYYRCDECGSFFRANIDHIVGISHNWHNRVVRMGIYLYEQHGVTAAKVRLFTDYGVRVPFSTLCDWAASPGRMFS